MKVIMICIIVFASYPLFAKKGELPKYFDVEQLFLGAIPYGEDLHINAQFTVPDNHKSTPRTKALRVYEKIDGRWVKSATLDATQDFTAKNKISIRGKVKLMSHNSDIAIDSTIVHCGKYCVINNFQGVTQRSKKATSPLVNLKLVGYLPTDKIKKQ